MEKRYRWSLLMWVGSILIALLIVGSLGFGAYRLYAIGWAHGATAAKDGILNDSPRVPLAPLPYYQHHRIFGSSFLLLIFTLVVVGALFRHATWRMHPDGYSWRHGPAKWAWQHHYANQTNCQQTHPQDGKSEDDEEGAV